MSLIILHLLIHSLVPKLRVWEREACSKRPWAAKSSADPTNHGGVLFELARPSGSVAVRRANSAVGEAARNRTRGLLASRGGPSGTHALQGRDSCCPA